MPHLQNFTGSLLLAAFTLLRPAIAGDPKRSGNYAGAVTYGTGIVEVSADIIIPECTPGIPFVQTVRYVSDGWVGLSAWSKTGLIQTGITCATESDNPDGSNATTEYRAWSQWAPDDVHYFKSKDFQVGDVVHAHAIAYSLTNGTCTITNRRTGEVLQRAFTNQTEWPLNLGDAEWITESQLTQTVFGASGTRGATYNPWRWENAQYTTQDGTTHNFTLDTANDHTLYTVLDGVQIAEGIYNGPGSILVNDTTPANYTLPGPCKPEDC